MAMTKIGTVSMHAVDDKEANLQKYYKYIDEAAEQGVKLIVFPEVSLTGSGEMTMVDTQPASARYFVDQAELVPEGPSTQRLIAKAKEYGMYICWGMLEQSADFSEVTYNTSVLVGPEGYVGKHRKIHQPGTERMYSFPGDCWEVFDTALGRVGIMVCYEKAFPEAARALKMKGADMILCTTAWPALNRKNGIDDPILNNYVRINRVRAMENSVFYVDANQASPEGEEFDSFGLAGHSRIINPLGEVLATTGFAESMAIAEVDIIKDVKYAFCDGNGIGTTSWIKDIHPEIYAPIYASFIK